MGHENIIDDLLDDLKPLRFGAPVTHVYNPLVYARKPYSQYCRRYGTPAKEIVLVGMNPGPWGMAQTGIPFGEITAVKEWMRYRSACWSTRQYAPQAAGDGIWLYAKRSQRQTVVGMGANNF